MEAQDYTAYWQRWNWNLGLLTWVDLISSFLQVTSWSLCLYFHSMLKGEFGLGLYPKGPSKYLPLKVSDHVQPSCVAENQREWKQKNERILSRLLKEQPSLTLATSRKSNYKFIQISGTETTYLPRGRYLKCWVFHLNMHFWKVLPIQPWGNQYPTQPETFSSSETISGAMENGWSQ